MLWPKFKCFNPQTLKEIIRLVKRIEERRRNNGRFGTCRHATDQNQEGRRIVGINLDSFHETGVSNQHLPQRKGSGWTHRNLRNSRKRDFAFDAMEHIKYLECPQGKRWDQGRDHHSRKKKLLRYPTCWMKRKTRRKIPNIKSRKDGDKSGISLLSSYLIQDLRITSSCQS